MFLLAFIRERSEPSESCQAVAAVELAAAAKKSLKARQQLPAFGRRGGQDCGSTTICIWRGFPKEQHAVTRTIPLL